MILLGKSAILPRQRYAFLLAAMSAPAVSVASGLSWPWVMAVMLLAAALLTGLAVAQSRSPWVLPLAVKRVWGKRFGSAVLLLQLLFFTVLLWQLALGADAAFPDRDTVPFVPLTLLAVCAWAAWQGRAACVRAVGVLFFFLAALYLTVFLFALPEMKPARLLEWDMTPELLPLGVVLLVPFCGLYLQQPGEERGKFPVGWLTAFVLLPAAAAAVCTAVPGSDGRFYEMAKSVKVLSFAQRMEPLVSCATAVGWFAAMSLVAVSAGELARALGVPSRWGSLLACLAAGGGVLWSARISAALLLPAGTVFCVVLPLITQGIAARKKLKKREK
mgnify:CR=1 FL=1